MIMEKKVNPVKKPKASKFAEVRMTKTARMRLLKANPLIKYAAEKTNNSILVENLDLDNVSRVTKAIVETSLSDRCKEGNKVQIKNKNERSTKMAIHQQPKKYMGTAKNSNKNGVKPPDVIVQAKNLRRSCSAPRLHQQMGTIYETQSCFQQPSNISVSIEDVSSVTNSTPQRGGNSTHTFKTPSGGRLSQYAASASRRKSHFCSSPSAAVELKRKLSDWLAKRNKKPSSYKHLKCFGVHKIDVISENDKENINTSNLDERGSYEDLKIDNPLNNTLHLEDTSLILAPSDLKRITKAALNDLHSLISEGYPREQCEAWLAVIKNKCQDVVEESQYWECRAAIDQLREDIGSAVECYKTAIVQGAEISVIENSLDQLLQKLKLLNIDSSTSEQEPKSKRMIQDFKNVFTSMIIKFAIQEKNSKKKSEDEQSKSLNPSNSSNLTKVLVTPVRRSTRLNRSGYTLTPGVKICSSLQEIDSEIKERMTFQANAALNV